MKNNEVEDKVTIANLKCAGCENTIKKSLLDLHGVSAVDIDKDQDLVTVKHDQTTSRKQITSKLHALGYPEATEENGLLLQLKSYASCMIGRVTEKV